MEHSDELRDLTLRLYEAEATGDVSFIERHLSRQEGAVYIGSDPNEWWEGFEAFVEVTAAAEKALVATLIEMYVQGVSTRKVKAITEELCGHAFSASSISAINKRLDESLAAFARRPLQEPFAYLILDARYEKVREAGVTDRFAVTVGSDLRKRAADLLRATAEFGSFPIVLETYRECLRDVFDLPALQGLLADAAYVPVHLEHH
mgnify:CR=1 FL=1